MPWLLSGDLVLGVTIYRELWSTSIRFATSLRRQYVHCACNSGIPNLGGAEPKDEEEDGPRFE